MPRGKRVRRNERSHGTGSIKDLPDGSARAWKPPQPRTDGSGATHRPSKLFHPPDARAKAEAWLTGLQPGPAMTLSYWCEVWFTRRAPTLNDLSRRRYANYFAMLEPLAERPIASITHDDWQDFLNTLLKTYARGTMDRARAIWSGALSAAVKAGHLRENALLGTKIGQADEKVPRAWRMDEQRRLTATARGEEHEAWLHTGLATGMRFEELRALEVDDVDFVRLTVLVRKAKGGRARLIPLAPEAAAILAERVKRLQPGAVLILGRPDGRAWSGPTLRRWLADLCKRAKVRVLPPHSMRHSYASTSIADGVDLAALSHDLGHRDVTITGKVYVSYITSQDRPTARAVSRRLYGAEEKRSRSTAQ